MTAIDSLVVPMLSVKVPDEDLCKVLLITDNLLAKLPDDVIEAFSQSEDFSLYEKVLNKYRIK
jgi:hypothetical protein